MRSSSSRVWEKESLWVFVRKIKSLLLYMFPPKIAFRFIILAKVHLILASNYHVHPFEHRQLTQKILNVIVWITTINLNLYLQQQISPETQHLALITFNGILSGYRIFLQFVLMCFWSVLMRLQLFWLSCVCNSLFLSLSLALDRCLAYLSQYHIASRTGWWQSRNVAIS